MLNLINKSINYINGIPKYTQDRFKRFDNSERGKVQNSQINLESKTELSGYKIRQAIFAGNNITFKNLTLPIDVTDKYNNRIPDKDHLDLPHIHVYEYPDTNLQVFLDENENMRNDSVIEARLYIKPQDNAPWSLIKNELCKRIISNNLQIQIADSKLKNNVHGFYTISAKTNQSDENFFKNLNKIISNPEFDKNIFETEKQKMINDIKSSDYTKNNAYILLDSKDLKTREECIKEINATSIEEVKDYYKNILKNSGAAYFITLNKNLTNNNKKSELLKELNSLPIRFKKINFYENNNIFITNKNPAIYLKDENIEGIEFNYPYEVKTLRDDYIGIFSSLILLFLAYPFIKEDSGCQNEEIPPMSKNSALNCKYYNLKFDLPKPEFTNLTPQRAQKIQKEIIKMVNDTDYTVTLEDIKETFKEIAADDICKNYEPDKNNESMYQYGNNIFQLYEIIDSIKTSDIKQHIEKYMIQQEPIVRYKERVRMRYK